MTRQARHSGESRIDQGSRRSRQSAAGRDRAFAEATDGRRSDGSKTAMYRYDEFDQEFVHERVAQFRGQVERRVVGRADRGPVQAAPADERRLPAAPRLHAAHRDPLRHAQPGAAAHARLHRAEVRPRLRPLHHAAEPPVQLAGAEGHPRHPRRPRLGRDARHPDLGQLHPQRHRRSFRRRRRATRSSIRGPMPRSSGSGRRCIRNSSSCRASSRSR